MRLLHALDHLIARGPARELVGLGQQRAFTRQLADAAGEDVVVGQPRHDLLGGQAFRDRDGMLHHLALDDGGDDVAQGGVFLERILTRLEVRARLQRGDAGDEHPGIDVGHAFPVQRLGDVALAGPLRDVDDLVFLQRPRRLEQLPAVIVDAAGAEHGDQQKGDDGVADDHEGIARPVRSPRRRRNLFGLQRCPRTPGRNGRPFTHRSNLNPAGSIAARQSLAEPNARAHVQ
ncbi:hypothetical protein BJS_03936 [Bradyrhizobium japonicum SEMIA 5079]|nr:hypothetical protein BJS_03936 [Bradyrhizobium japonicum SEMIA 5079]